MKSLVFSLALLTASPVFAAEVTVEMLNNRDGNMFVYSSKIVRIAIGDVVTWKATNAGHNAVFVPKAFPEGAAPLVTSQEWYRPRWVEERVTWFG